MIKLFDAYTLRELQDQLARFGDRNEIEIVSISHCQVLRRGLFSALKEWNAFVAYKNK